jgi:GTP cyclohydrolase II
MTLPPPATVRARVPLPLRLDDGSNVPAVVVTFDGLADGREHLALALGSCARATAPPAVPSPSRRSGRGGDPCHTGGSAPLVRVHSECLTGDVLGSRRCDCGPQLHEALRRLGDAGGYLLYLRQEGRGIGLYAKLDAYALQDGGLDTFDANVALGFAEDARDYTVAAQMLHALGVPRVALMSNNPDKAAQLARCGVQVTARVPTAAHVDPANARYLAAKVTRHAHTLDLPV